MEIRDMTGLVLEGGGMRGIYTAGVLDVFMDEKMHFDGVIGVSAGAIHGCTFVAGQRGRNLRYYKKYCNDKRFMSFRNVLLTGDIAGEQFCYHDLPERLDPFDYESFLANDTKFYVTCSNLKTGRAEYIQLRDMKEEIDLLRASASLPYVSRIVRTKGLELLDGGCTDSIPVAAFRNMGYEKSVVVLTRHRGYVKPDEKKGLGKVFYGKYPEFVKAMENRPKVYNRTLKDIEELEKQGKIFVIAPSEPLQIGRLEKDPEKLQEVYDIGMKDALEQMEALKIWMTQK
ncbi:MAG: patatin family protein [Lachnospiraceae bacterium]